MKRLKLIEPSRHLPFYSQAFALMTVKRKYVSLRPWICCFFKNLAVNYFTFTAVHSVDKFLNEQQIFGLIKAKDLLLIRKLVRRMKDSKRKIVNGQIFEKAVNLVSYFLWSAIKFF